MTICPAQPRSAPSPAPIGVNFLGPGLEFKKKIGPTIEVISFPSPILGMIILPKPNRGLAELAIWVWGLPDFSPDGGGYRERGEIPKLNLYNIYLSIYLS